MKTILIVEDDTDIGNMVEEVLQRAGYSVLRAYSGTEALLCIPVKRPDLILLDLMLPGLCGEEVLEACREIPVIVVSAKTAVSGKVELLMKGACDYIIKPFDTSELLARVAVQLRRAALPEQHIWEFDGLVLRESSRSADYDGKQVRLTRTEFAILKLLMQNPNQVITKSQILDLIANETPDCTESTLKVHISNIRIKLREMTGKDYIEAVWGIGFKLRAGT